MSVGPRSAFLSVATELVEEREVVVQCLREFGYGLADKLREAELFVAVLGERPDEQVIAALSQDASPKRERLTDLAEHLLDSEPAPHQGVS